MALTVESFTLPSPVIEMVYPGTAVTDWLPKLASASRALDRARLDADQFAATSSMTLQWGSRQAWQATWAATLARVASLRAGWDGPRSVPVDPLVLTKASLLVARTLSGMPKAAPPYLIPAGDGSVQIEWHQKTGELEFSLDADGRQWAWIRDHSSGEEFEGEDERASALFASWAARIATDHRDEGDVRVPANTSILGVIATIPIYQNDPVA